MSNTNTHDQQVPRGALIGAAGLIVITMVASGVTHIVGAPSMVPESNAVVVRDLHFTDTADGEINVFDDSSAKPVNVIGNGSDAFLRATLRGLAQQRKREYMGPEVPFRLTAWADGRLTLDDPATGRHIELEAFGPTNEGAFVRLLKPDAEVPAQ